MSSKLGEPQTFVAPDGTVMAVLPLDEVERLRDAAEEAGLARLADAAARRIASGEDEYIPWDMAKRLRRGENRVRLWREHRGLRLGELADASGVSQAYLSQIESGAREGAASTLAAIAEALGVKVDDLIARRPDRPRAAALGEAEQAPFEAKRKAPGFDGRLAATPEPARSAAKALLALLGEFPELRAWDEAKGEGRIFKLGRRNVVRLDPKPNANLWVRFYCPHEQVEEALAADISRGAVKPRRNREPTWTWLLHWDDALAGRVRRLVGRLIAARRAPAR